MSRMFIYIYTRPSTSFIIDPGVLGDNTATTDISPLKDEIKF